MSEYRGKYLSNVLDNANPQIPCFTVMFLYTIKILKNSPGQKSFDKTFVILCVGFLIT